jgi:hypothetical protein
MFCGEPTDPIEPMFPMFPDVFKLMAKGDTSGDNALIAGLLYT